MSRFDSLVSRADYQIEKDLEKEPTYSPGDPQPARPSRSRYYFMGANLYTCCGESNRCACNDNSSDKEDTDA